MKTVLTFLLIRFAIVAVAVIALALVVLAVVLHLKRKGKWERARRHVAPFASEVADRYVGHARRGSRHPGASKTVRAAADRVDDEGKGR